MPALEAAAHGRGPCRYFRLQPTLTAIAICEWRPALLERMESEAAAYVKAHAALLDEVAGVLLAARPHRRRHKSSSTAQQPL